MSGRPGGRTAKGRLGLGLATIGACLALAAEAAPCDRPQRDSELRYWSDPGTPEARHSTVLSSFKRAHPCPATGASTGPCAGWILDHVIPLACGGADAVFNLQWLPTAMWREKSKWERRIYLSPGQAATAYCGPWKPVTDDRQPAGVSRATP